MGKSNTIDINLVNGFTVYVEDSLAQVMVKDEDGHMIHVTVNKRGRVRVYQDDRNIFERGVEYHRDTVKEEVGSNGTV